MEKLIIILKNSLKMYLVLLIYLLLISIIYYFEILNYKVINIISYILVILLFLILGIKVSKKIKSKGYLNGFIAGLTNISIFILLSIIFNKISLNSVIYYSILILSSVIGGIIGAQEKIE